MVAGEAVSVAAEPAVVGGMDGMAQQAEKEAMMRAAADGAGSAGHKRKFVAASGQASKAAAVDLGDSSRSRPNPDEIDIDDIDEGGDGDDGVPAVKQKTVPQAVFGSVVAEQ
jgi:hypothetical protein